MKRVISRSLPLTCLIVSGMGLTALAQAGTTPAAAPAASGAAPAGAAAAAPTGTTKIAVINFEAAVMQTNEGQRNFGELRKKFEPKQAELKKDADDIDALKKQLQTAGDKLSDAERQARLKSIDDKEKAYQRSGEDAQNDFQQEMAQTYQQIAEKVFGTVQSYAAQNDFGVVLDRSESQQQQLPTVLWASQGTDITMAVIQAYNAKSGVPAPAAGVPSAPAPTHTTTPRATTPNSPK